MLVDSDVLARDVVAPGTTGLGEIVAAFGTGVLAPDGSLERAALAAVVFGDPEAAPGSTRSCTRACANAPRNWWRPRPATRSWCRTSRCSSRPARPRRSRWSWSCTPTRRCGCAASSTRGAWRRWTPGPGSPRRRRRRAPRRRRRRPRQRRPAGGAARGRRRRCGTAGSCPSRPTCAPGRPVPAPSGAPIEADPRWAADGARIASRVARAAGRGARGVAHVGPTAVPGLPAADVLDLQVAVDPAADRRGAGRARRGRLPPGRRRDAGGGVVARRGRPRTPGAGGAAGAGSPAWRAALLWRDWLRADGASRAEYGDRPTSSSTQFTRAEEWAASSGWTPSLDEQA